MSRSSVFDRCQYKECTNGKYTTGDHLFRFPAAEQRLDTWITNSGNDALRKWSKNSIRKAGLCKIHFLPEAFTNYVSKRLLPNAVPIPFNIVRAEEVVKTEAGQTKNEEAVANEIEIPNFEEVVNEIEIPGFEEVIEIPTIEPLPKKTDTLKTYVSMNKNSFEDEEEHESMEWIHIEPTKPIRDEDIAVSTSHLSEESIQKLIFEKKEKKLIDMLEKQKYQNMLMKKKMERMRLKIMRQQELSKKMIRFLERNRQLLEKNGK